MKQKSIRWMRVLAGFSVLTILACSAGFFTYNGLVVSEDNLNRLKTGGPHDGFLKTDDLALIYRYTRRSNGLTISGEVQFADRLKNNYRSLEGFDLRVHFINSENKIVGYENLNVIGYFFEIDRIPFGETMGLPPDVKGISFSYSGRVTDGGSGLNDPQGGGISLDFWKTPDG